MPAVAGTVAGLGVGAYPGQTKIIQYGPAGQEERFALRWREDFTPAASWVADPRLTFSLRNGWLIDLRGVGGSATYGYLTTPYEQRIGALIDGYFRKFGESSYGFNPRAIRHADAAFAAGLRLQERLILSAWGWSSSDVATLTTVWYPKGVGDDISNVDNPDAHLGISVVLPATRRYFSNTGWLNSAKQSSTKPNLAPHLYSTKDKEGVLEFLLAQWRWVGTPP